MKNRIITRILHFRQTIRMRLLSTAFGILILLVAIGVITAFFLKQIFDYHNIKQTIANISYLHMELNKIEHEFLLHETTNPDFFNAGESTVYQKFITKSYSAQSLTDSLKNDEELQDVSEIQHNLVLLKTNINDYTKTFEELVELIKQKGFKDFGVVGELREHIHLIENQLSTLQDSGKLSVHMLMLRRHEKDYLLRKDVKYEQKFDNEVIKFQATLKNYYNNDWFTESDYQKLNETLENYQTYFQAIVNYDLMIGTDTTNGLLLDLENYNTQIVENLNQLHSQIDEHAQVQIQNSILFLFITGLLLSVVIILLLLQVSKYIVFSIKYLQKHITRLGEGDIPETIHPKKHDEIAEMIQSINKLTQNLNNVGHFAVAVAQKNFSTEFEPMSGKDKLGHSLLKLRNSLQEAEKIEERNRIENEKRNWTNEGLAMFGDILRESDSDIRDLAGEITSSMVKYLGATQGALFIINDQNPEDVFIEQLATFAYNRHRKMRQRIELEEGLVGRCIEEAETLYMTELPESYIEITSGLGKHEPTSLLIVPLKDNEKVLAAIELASFKEFEPYQQEFVKKAGQNIAATLATARINARTNELLQQASENAEKMAEQELQMHDEIEKIEKERNEYERRYRALNEELKHLKVQLTKEEKSKE